MKTKYPLYPNVVVKFSGEDGNAFNLLGIVMREMKRNGIPKENITAFHEAATSGDYDHLIQTCMNWVTVE